MTISTVKSGLQSARRAIRETIRRCGYDVQHYDRARLGQDPFTDIRYFLKGRERPVIFDVGANVGQSVDAFRKALPDAIIHSFEPSPGTYAQLSEHCRSLNRVKTWNVGVGSSQATLTFLENNDSKMSSFLPLSEHSWGKIVKETKCNVLTLDSFAEEQHVEFIHVLKTDTQGFDFEVFKGADRLMKEDRIGLIHFEFIFSDQYKHLPSFHDVYSFLLERNLSLVTYYKPYFQGDLLSWTDFLFINRKFLRPCVGDHKSLAPV